VVYVFYWLELVLDCVVVIQTDSDFNLYHLLKIDLLYVPRTTRVAQPVFSHFYTPANTKRFFCW